MLYDRKKDLNEDGKIFLKAAGYIQEHGWCRGVLERDGRVCMAGALRKALDLPMMYVSPFVTKKKEQNYHRLMEKLELGIADGSGVGTWNDRDDRTMEQVIEKLESVAYKETINVI